MARNIKQVFLFKTPIDLLLTLREKDNLCFRDMLRINEVKSLDDYKDTIDIFLKKHLVTFSIPKGNRRYYSLTVKGRKLAELFYDLNELLRN